MKNFLKTLGYGSLPFLGVGALILGWWLGSLVVPASILTMLGNAIAFIFVVALAVGFIFAVGILIRSALGHKPEDIV